LYLSADRLDESLSSHVVGRHSEEIYADTTRRLTNVYAARFGGQRRMSGNRLFAGMIVSAAVGFTVSTYLTYLSLTPPTSCPVDDFGIFSCNEVIWSEYSHFFGVSVALLGLGWFAVVSVLLALAWRDERFMRGVVAWSLLGAAGVVGFVYTEVFLLRSICLLCTVAHLSGLAILALSILALRAPRETRQL
jgi:uncharacterized membrane protein